MTQPAPMTPDQEELFGLTKKTHAQALNLIAVALAEHAKETDQVPTNGMQFAAVDGFMAAAGQILAAMTVDTIQNGGMDEKQILEGSVGALFMFQKTLENVFSETIWKANMEGVDVEAMLEDFAQKYKEQTAKAGQ